MAEAQLEACCAERSNRLPVFARLGPGFSLQLCGVCGRRHVTLKAAEARLERGPVPAGA